MGIIDRLSTLIKSNLNDLISKAENPEKKLSYVDCIGYTIAWQRNIPFVTGDIAFREMPNVYYLK